MLYVIILGIVEWMMMYIFGGANLVASTLAIGVAAVSYALRWMHRYPDVRRR